MKNLGSLLKYSQKYWGPVGGDQKLWPKSSFFAVVSLINHGRQCCYVGFASLANRSELALLLLCSTNTDFVSVKLPGFNLLQ